MGDRIVDSFNSIKDVPEIAAGKGWYSRMRKKLSDALGPDAEIFAQLLGATSAKTPVRTNFINALDAYEQWKEGQKDPSNMNLGFNRHINKYMEAYNKLEEGPGALTQHMRDQGILKAGDPDHASDADAMAHWIEHHDILPKTKTGSKYSANSNAVLKVLGGTWLKDVGAPKTPNFAGNLTGRTLEATIDVWAARHLQRLGYEGHMKGPWRRQSRAESGVNNLDFAFSQDAMRHAADKIGINPDDLQAILWFAEKHHYEGRGWTRGQGAEKSSFDDVADKVFGKSGQPMDRPMTSEDLRAHYAKEAKGRQQRQGKIETARTYTGLTAHKLAPYMAKHGLTHEEVHGTPGEEETGVLHMDTGGVVPAPSDFTSMIAGQPMSESDAPRAMPVVPKAQPVQTPAVTTGPATLPTGSSSPSQMDDVRAPLAQEFQSNPDLKRKFMALISAEAGDQSDQAKLAFAESIVNRAIARGQDLYGTLDNTYGHYFPPKTINQLGRPISASEQKVLSPFIDKVMNGSNISNYATGNESGPKDLSEGAPITFKPGGPKDYERFMIENPDLGWASKLSPVPIVSGSFPGSE
jgi:hypothetical protein